MRVVLAVAVLALMAFEDAPVAAQTRTVSGEAVHRERIALPEDAALLFEVRDPDGRIVGEAVFAQDGRQSPLPFALNVPDGRDLVLHAAIIDGARTWFTAGPVPLRAGSDAIALGPVVMTRHADTGFDSAFRCGATEVEAATLDEGLRLRLPGRTIDLAPTPAASGARFEAGPQTWFWSHGTAATLSLDGTVLPECHQAVPPAFFPFIARGNEPAWRLELGGGRAVLVTDLGKTRRDLPLAEPEQTASGLVYRLGDDVTVRIASEIARDSMTGLPFPYSVEASIEQQRLTGVGGDPLSLLAGERRIVRAGGITVPDGVEATLDIASSGAYAGRSGCNRYAGKLLLGERLSMGNAVSTRMACPEPAMAVERAVFAAFDAAVGFDITPDGALVLRDETGDEVLVARR